MRELLEPLDSVTDRVRALQIAAWEAGSARTHRGASCYPDEITGSDTLMDLIYSEVLLREGTRRPAESGRIFRSIPAV